MNGFRVCDQNCYNLCHIGIAEDGKEMNFVADLKK